MVTPLVTVGVVVIVVPVVAAKEMLFPIVPGVRATSFTRSKSSSGTAYTLGSPPGRFAIVSDATQDPPLIPLPVPLIRLARLVVMVSSVSPESTVY